MNLTHTNAQQEQRFWIFQDRFNGHNGNYLSFLSEVIKEMKNNQFKYKEPSRYYKIIDRTIKYLTVIYNLNLSSKKAIQENDQIKKIREIIKLVPLPNTCKVKLSTKVKRKDAEGNDYDVDLDSDFEIEKPKDALNWPKGWLESVGEREVSNYIKNMVDAAVNGPALDVICNMGMARDRTGFETIERLADVYGRNAALIVQIPWNFLWGNNSMVYDWNNYKHQIDGNEYTRIHPQNTPAVIHQAVKGLHKYDNSFRLLDHIRCSVGEFPTWDEFKEAVDKFMGDVHRSHFVTNVFSNHNGLSAMNTAGVLEADDENDEVIQVNYIANEFRGRYQNKNKKGYDKNKGNNGKNGQSNYTKQQQGNNPQVSDKPNPQKGKGKGKGKNKKPERMCLWCGEKTHYSNQCKTFGNGKWDGKQCNKCKGYGHPQDLCTTPSKKIKENTKK